MNWHRTWFPLGCVLFAAGVLAGRLTVSPTAQAQLASTPEPAPRVGRVTGIGGVFFKSDHPDSLRNWYRDHLGMVTNEYGSLFEFRLAERPDVLGYLQWSLFKNTTKYFQPSTKPFMINYRVADLTVLLERLKKDGVQVLDEPESASYGTFVHIMDPEGNKIELWEPVDSTFTAEDSGQTTH
jgi:predicted enzyme related to lactoylglutathione lyase